jgi:signal transduction histidine kinase
VRPVDGTLKWVVVQYRLLCTLWVLVLVVVQWIDTEGHNPDRRVLAAGGVLAVFWTGVTVWASRGNDLLGSRWFAALDGVVILTLSFGGLVAGSGDFFSGGYPGSWLFVVAFATNLRWTMFASLLVMAEHIYLHFAMDLTINRTAGTLQFPVLALIIGWAFDALRQREQMRLRAQEELAAEKEASARHQERALLAQRLHDSVLQTLHAIRAHADDAAEVRYAARRQERELRRTIEELSSPYDRSFRAALMAARDQVEDLFPRVEIDLVVRSDLELNDSLDAGLIVAREAMINSAKHSGERRVDVYSELSDRTMVVRVRDRGGGVTEAEGNRILTGKTRSMSNRLAAVGGRVHIDSTPGSGTEVAIEVPVT